VHTYQKASNDSPEANKSDVEIESCIDFSPSNHGIASERGRCSSDVHTTKSSNHYSADCEDCLSAGGNQLRFNSEIARTDRSAMKNSCQAPTTSSCSLQQVNEQHQQHPPNHTLEKTFDLLAQSAIESSHVQEHPSMESSNFTQNGGDSDQTLHTFPIAIVPDASGGSPLKASASANASTPSLTEEANCSSVFSFVATSGTIISDFNRRSRVPGGAAAKLMFVGPQGTFSQGDDEETPLIMSPPSKESIAINETKKNDQILHTIMEQTKAEFITGSPFNRRYKHTPTTEASSNANDNVLTNAEVVSESFSKLSHLEHISIAASSLPTYEHPFAIEKPLGSMETPNKTLYDLLATICSPPDGADPDIGYTVRRKNSCGALQVLTADPRKRIHLCRTLGVLTALTSVLMDSRECGLGDNLDNRHHNELKSACNRAVSCLLNLSKPKDNRICIFRSPFLVQALIAVIAEDKGVARCGCCAVLAFVTKSVENRIQLTRFPDMLPALVQALIPELPQFKNSNPMKPFEGVCPLSSDEAAEWKKSMESIVSTPLSSSPSLISSHHASQNDSTDLTHCDMVSQTSARLKHYSNVTNPVVQATRQHVFATLSNLVKQKENVLHLTCNSMFVDALVNISKYQGCPFHSVAIRLLANLTRHKSNSEILVFKHPSVVAAFVGAMNSESVNCWRFACFALQNLAQEKCFRIKLAATERLIVSLCNCACNSSDEKTRLAAISTLRSLTNEPANLIPIVNSSDCVSTLMHLAYAKQSGITQIMQYHACDALAHLSYWLQILGADDHPLEWAEKMKIAEARLAVPTLRVVPWKKWE
jgi:hypothetical protein